MKYVRPDQCFKCTSRNCPEHIYRDEPPYFNEVACRKHRDDLHKYVDQILGVKNGVMRIYRSSTGACSRNDVPKVAKLIKKELVSLTK